RAIPPPRPAQTTTGGVILTDLSARIHGTQVKPPKQLDVTATGECLPDPASFMALRHPPAPDTPANPTPDQASQPTTRTTSVSPGLLLNGPRFTFLAQLHLPGARLTQTTRPEDNTPAIRITLPDGSWSETSRTRSDNGR